MINYTLAIQGLINPELRAMADRIKFIHSNFKNCLDGIEVGFFAHKYLEFLEVMKSRDVVNIMGKFKFNTLHIAVRKEDPVPESVLVEIVQTANSLWKRGLITAAGFHLDMSSQFDLISGEAVEGLPLRWEILGADTLSGNSFQEAGRAVNNFPEWDIILDLAHVREMESRGEPPMGKYMETHSSKIKQWHVSYPGNLYSDLLGRDFVTSHSMLSLRAGGVDEVLSCRNPVNVEVITLEGVVPFGATGVELVYKELELLRDYLTV